MEKVERLQKQLGPAKEPAEPPPPPPAFNEADQAKILEKVEMLQKEFERQRREVVQSALTRYESASSSESAAFEFFLQCQQAIKARMPDVDPANDRQDAKAQAEKQKAEIAEYQAARGKAAALQIVLQHLVLTLQAPTVKDRGSLVSRLRDMIGKAVNAAATYSAPNAEPVKKVPVATNSKGRARSPQAQTQVRSREEDRARKQIIQAMQQAAVSSVFGQAYNLSNYFETMENWSDSPLDLDGNYDNFILAYYRKSNPEELHNVWDEYLARALMLHRCTDDDNALANWVINGYKDLQWKRSMDLLKYGTRRAVALDDLVKMVKENLTNPNVKNWVTEMANVAAMIKPPAVAEAPPEQPAPDATTPPPATDADKSAK